jgi:hypothetical protein
MKLAKSDWRDARDIRALDFFGSLSSVLNIADIQTSRTTGSEAHRLTCYGHVLLSRVL